MITINIYYKGKSGSARRFAEEMENRGTAEAIRAEEGNIRYEYFYPRNDPETVLLIDAWRAQAALDGRRILPLTRERPEITIRRSPRQAKFIRFTEKNYFGLLRSKLSEWTH